MIKNILVIILLFLFSILVTSQINPIVKIFSEYYNLFSNVVSNDVAHIVDFEKKIE